MTKILYVEDDWPVYKETLAFLCREYPGHEFLGARTYAEARAICEEATTEPISGVITDWMFPNLAGRAINEKDDGGLELAKYLTPKKVPFIICSETRPDWIMDDLKRAGILFPENRIFPKSAIKAGQAFETLITIMLKAERHDRAARSKEHAANCGD